MYLMPLQPLNILTGAGMEDQVNHKFKKILVAKKIKLLSDIKKALGDRLDDDIRLTFEVLKDNPDRSVDELLKHVDARIIGNRSEEIDDIDSALAKIEEGTYGICGACGAEIPLKRLSAVPCAIYCVKCQTVIDKAEKDRQTGKDRTRAIQPDNHVFSETE